MTIPGTAGTQYEVGTYTCPVTQQQVPVMSTQSLAFIHWPLEITECASCGKPHTLNATDVLHPPIYGRE
jgi:hypothetical protein